MVQKHICDGVNSTKLARFILKVLYFDTKQIYEE